ncbi:MAG: hypothetical protein RIA63_05960 [Cyclobacteriaceae bacterium]
MRYLLPILVVFICGCQGKLTEEQKKEMKEGMDASKIVKITEAEIIDAAFKYGRKISDESKNLNPDLEDSIVTQRLQHEFSVEIFPLAPGDSLLHEIEQQLIEAYTSAIDIELTDNIQKIGNDSLLYTLPVMEEQADGSVRFKYALGIRMPKKAVILSMKE